MLRNRGNESRAVAECVRQSWEQRERCEGAEKAPPGNGTSAHQFVYTVDESSHSPYRARYEKRHHSLQELPLAEAETSPERVRSGRCRCSQGPSAPGLAGIAIAGGCGPGARPD